MVSELQYLDAFEAKERVKMRKKMARQEARVKFAAQIEAYAQELIREEEVAFALKLKALQEAGASGADIRREVLRTNDWPTWEKWRDLAGMEDDKKRKATLRQEATVEKIRVGDGFAWSEDWDMLTWTAHPVTGAAVTVEIPVGAGAFEMYAAQGTQAAVYALAGMYDRDEFAQFHPLGDYAAMEGELRGVHSKEYVAWVTALSEAIKAAVNAGKIPEITKEDV